MSRASRGSPLPEGVDLRITPGMLRRGGNAGLCQITRRGRWVKLLRKL
jgi:hypothetical protein